MVLDRHKACSLPSGTHSAPLKIVGRGAIGHKDLKNVKSCVWYEWIVAEFCVDDNA